MNDLHNVVIKEKVKQKRLLAFNSFVIQLLGGASFWKDICLVLFTSLDFTKKTLKFFEFAVARNYYTVNQKDLF